MTGPENKYRGRERMEPRLERRWDMMEEEEIVFSGSDRWNQEEFDDLRGRLYS